MLQILSKLKNLLLSKEEQPEDHGECRNPLGKLECDKPKGHVGWHGVKDAGIMWGDKWQ